MLLFHFLKGKKNIVLSLEIFHNGEKTQTFSSLTVIIIRYFIGLAPLSPSYFLPFARQNSTAIDQLSSANFATFPKSPPPSQNDSRNRRAEAETGPFKFGIHPIPYPVILGTSFAGTIKSVPPSSTTTFKQGDNVAVIRTGARLGDLRFGGFQKFALAKSSSVSKLQPSTQIAAAAVSILNLAAVVSALSIHLGLSRPPLSGVAPSSNEDQKVLVYGGSSSCSGLAVRYAATAGYTVVTTSSAANRTFVASLGPAHIMNHTLPASEIISEIRAESAHAAIFDTIGLPPVTDLLVKYLTSIGGGSYNTLIPLLGPEKPIPANVERESVP